MSGALDAINSLVHHAPLAYERVVYPCSTMNCGDAVYRRCASRMYDDCACSFI